MHQPTDVALQHGLALRPRQCWRRKYRRPSIFGPRSGARTGGNASHRRHDRCWGAGGDKGQFDFPPKAFDSRGRQSGIVEVVDSLDFASQREVDFAVPTSGRARREFPPNRTFRPWRCSTRLRRRQCCSRPKSGPER
ncbi:hypothetical protein I552_6793 [Mycobacterium xenopi 3993]|nr:hypothetical protein I552_6793 [Mycobacterium xenopi 3993]